MVQMWAFYLAVIKAKKEKDEGWYEYGLIQIKAYLVLFI